MIEYTCPNCGEAKLIVERTILEDELFEEISCPKCGYYDSNIEILSPKENFYSDDFVF